MLDEPQATVEQQKYVVFFFLGCFGMKSFKVLTLKVIAAAAAAAVAAAASAT